MEGKTGKISSNAKGKDCIYMKKNRTRERTLTRQLISGGVYIALSAVVVAVTVNTVVSLISGDSAMPDLNESLDGIEFEMNTLPEISDISELPELSSAGENALFPEVEPLFPSQDAPVSDTAEGIDALIEEQIPSEQLSSSSPDALSIPEGADLGLDKFIKPCDGYVNKEYSIDVPVYSATMFDYRTHAGVDIVCDEGSTVKACIGGIITDIYNDDLYGTTVSVTSESGHRTVYSNLMPTLSAGIEKGAVIPTGAIIGGVGSSALCEAAEAPHLHLEIYGPDGASLDPEDFISF